MCLLRLDLNLYSHPKIKEIEVKFLSHSKQATDQRQDGDLNSHLLAELTFSPAGKLKSSSLTPWPPTPPDKLHFFVFTIQKSTSYFDRRHFLVLVLVEVLS